MNNATDQDVWDAEARKIKDTGGIGNPDVMNTRRPPNTFGDALSDNHPKKQKYDAQKAKSHKDVKNFC